ncbi:hypothetical protein LOTGIDRAFT_171651 [Lottia gigantea]|uniref:Uncharacterized protein n=1 Tax=Lottia gigantea TaxID=225164 RepID=V4AZL3_LOTGI|nr:hypothetical protein LOTGIDRAFT_171651 [Lottia gigantea]ESP03178.1 hypothetical protein LOTGIDRAFT_171651 [Lottia gigantea]
MNTTSLIWLSVTDNVNVIVKTLRNITSVSPVDNPYTQFIPDNVISILSQYGKLFCDRRFSVLIMVLVPLLFFISSKSSRKRKRKTNEPLPSCFNENKSERSNIFDVAKTAYEEGHTEQVIEMVESTGYDVNYIPPLSDLSLFLCGCLSGCENLIIYLLKKGGDVLSTTEDGDTPLYLATFGVLNSESPNLNVIKILLIAGADPNICNEAGIYPIDSAINAGNLEAAELLRIDINNPYERDFGQPQTPTHITVGLQSPQRKLLMESSRHRQSHLLDH